MAGRVEGSVWGYHNTATMLGLAAAVWRGWGEEEEMGRN